MIKMGYNEMIDEAIGEDLLIKLCGALHDAGINYSLTGKRRDIIQVSKNDLEEASIIRNRIDPKYLITVCSRA